MPGRAPFLSAFQRREAVMGSDVQDKGSGSG
jgi:hypothetical protein